MKRRVNGSIRRFICVHVIGLPCTRKNLARAQNAINAVKNELTACAYGLVGGAVAGYLVGHAIGLLITKL